MRIILRGDATAKIKGGLPYNIFVKTPSPPNYNPLNLDEKYCFYLFSPVWKKLEQNLAGLG